MSAFYRLFSEFYCDLCDRGYSSDLRGPSAQGLVLEAREKARQLGWILPKGRTGVTLCPYCK